MTIIRLEKDDILDVGSGVFTAPSTGNYEIIGDTISIPNSPPFRPTNVSSISQKLTWLPSHALGGLLILLATRLGLTLSEFEELIDTAHKAGSIDKVVGQINSKVFEELGT